MQNTEDKGSQYLRTSLEAIGLWSAAHMQILRQLLDCSASTVKEGVSLAIELQTSAFETAQQGHTCMLKQITELLEAPRNPLAYYQQSLMACVDTAEQVYKLSLGNTQVVLRSAEQIGLVVQQTSKRIQESSQGLADQLQSLYATLR